MVAYYRKPFVANTMVWQWYSIVGHAVFSTLQVQEFCDQEGDRARSRRKIPIIMGDRASRWSVAFPVMFWSLYGPWFLELANISRDRRCGLSRLLSGPDT